ncbi:hypothetical protein H6F43_17455 [Leptolyngbya sp. FACHB-36]|uniref:hypothetical protein n=1 Tax=Leptolyngbya sp. FACHB-36 TaxID=2692808 RepID=UPI0016805676|nr:hypothetical protein [Leptolyngbya sp. FACHB-36]MBD2021968.1 hypothetical protein [Leptolyngbya sp. FACHB-36]
MQPASQSTSSPERQANKFADFLGILIAVLTLALPLAMIAHYSSRADAPSMAPYALQESSRE